MTDENYKIEQIERVLIIHSPSFLSEEMVDQFIDEIDSIIQDISLVCADSGENEADKVPRCALILNLAALSISTMTTDQMREFVSMMARYHFANLVAIPPQEQVFGQSQVLTLLNQSLPMFSKKGIHVTILNDLEVAKEKVKEFPCYLA